MTRAASNGICPVTGEKIEDGGHVDHAPPWSFERIVDEFVKDNAIDVESVAYLDGDGQTQSVFADPALARSFAEYHRARAKLRLVSKHANLSVLKKKCRHLLSRPGDEACPSCHAPLLAK